MMIISREVIINSQFNEVLENSIKNLELTNYTEIYNKEKFRCKTSDFNYMLFSCNRYCINEMKYDLNKEENKFYFDKYTNNCVRKCYKYAYSLNKLTEEHEEKIDRIGENL